MTQSQENKQPSQRTSTGIVALAVVLAAAVGVVGFLSGFAYEAGQRPPEIGVTPSLVPLGSLKNFSLWSGCDGPTQSSSDGWWECDITVENTGTDYGAVLNASAPLAVNVVVTGLPLNLGPGDFGSFEVTGQLGYSGPVAVYLGIYL